MPGLLESAETSEEKKDRTDPDGVLDFLQKAKMESEEHLTEYHQRWAKNIRLVKGVFSEEETTKSKVRGRSKLFFRKTWSNNIRILASFYQAFLKDPDNFKILGRLGEDEAEAAVLQILTEYRRDNMLRHQGLFRKLLTGFIDILECGIAPALLTWKKKDGYDGPCFRPYAPEQVYPDMTAETPDEMAHVLIEDFLTLEQMKQDKFENIDQVQPVSTPYNIVRSSRYLNQRDPIAGNGDKEYPSPGKIGENAPSFNTGKKYRVFHAFYRKGGDVYYCVVSGDFKVHHKKPKANLYGKRIPVILGICLPLAHKLFGEGFPEPQEGAQESYNDTINRRKDNVALFMNRGTVVSRFGNVDLQSLVNSRPGGVTLADNVEAVKERQMGDITQSAYIEAANEDAMMQELSGVTDIKLGQAKNEKATTASINQAEAGAKIDLFIAIVAETYIREFFSLLAYLEQRFESDRDILRIANQTLRKKAPALSRPYDIVEVDDFEADCIVDVGPGTVGRELEIRQTFIAMDRGIMANQGTLAILKTGVVPPDGLEIINITQFWADYMGKIGHKNTDKYKIRLPPPPPPQQEPNPLSGADSLVGGGMPSRDVLGGINDLQAGGLGGL